MSVPPQQVVQGDTWTVQVGYYEPKPGVEPPQPDLNRPVDLTGWSAKLQVRRKPGTTPVLTLTSAPGGGLTVNGTDGTIDVRATPTQTEAIDPGQWRYEVQIDNGQTGAGHDRRTIASEPLVILPQVTT